MTDIFEEIHDLSRQNSYQKVIEKLLANNGQSIRSPYDSDLNHAWYLIGDAYYRLGNLEFAVSAFKKAIQQWADDKDAILALSNCYSELNSLSDAENVLRTAIQKWPGDGYYWYNLGNSLFDQRKYEESIAAYQNVVGDEELTSMAKSNIEAAKNKLSMLRIQRKQPT